jgi:hypothetical protein
VLVVGQRRLHLVELKYYTSALRGILVGQDFG